RWPPVADLAQHSDGHPLWCPAHGNPITRKFAWLSQKINFKIHFLILAHISIYQRASYTMACLAGFKFERPISECP
ncbi:MAG: hypothetical protein QNI94_14985, partial [Kiloniellales bacterium]|nr:hypothetical protein [Kiloniellales bacterium]